VGGRVGGWVGVCRVCGPDVISVCACACACAVRVRLWRQIVGGAFVVADVISGLLTGRSILPLGIIGIGVTLCLPASVIYFFTACSSRYALCHLPPSLREFFFLSRDLEREERRGVASASLSRPSEEREVGSEAGVGGGRGRERRLPPVTLSPALLNFFCCCFLFFE